MNNLLSKYKLFYFFALSILLMGFSCEKEPVETPLVSLPTPKIEHFSDSVYIISNSSSISHSNSFVGYSSSLSSLKNTITTYGSNKENKPELIFQIITDTINTIPRFKNYIDIHESYAISFTNRKVIIQSKSEQGLLNGLTTLEYLIIKNKGELKVSLIIDYPDIKRRVLHLPLWPGELKTYENIIRLARFNHYNTLILLNFKGVKLNSLKHLTKENALSKRDFKKLLSYAKENGLEVVPELKLLSHQEKFFGETHPELMFNKSTYDPRKNKVYKYVYAAIDEIVGLTGATKFHIGHDEVVGYKKADYKKGRLLEGETQLPAELYLYDIIVINDYLNSKNIETWMWGDMLISAEQYSTIKKTGAYHGNKSYSKIVKKLPKNITICDWHYNEDQTEFPSSYSFAKEDFKVYGATWKNKETIKNFSKYITEMNGNAEGMIATTWHRIDRKTELVVDIINYSGETFWNAKN